MLRQSLGAHNAATGKFDKANKLHLGCCNINCAPCDARHNIIYTYDRDDNVWAGAGDDELNGGSRGMAQVGDDLVIEYGNNDSITLLGVELASLSEADFII